MRLNTSPLSPSASVLKLLTAAACVFVTVANAVAAPPLLFGLRSFGTAVAIQSDGKIITAGRTGYKGLTGDNYNVAVSRTNPDGSVDTGFGSLGVVVTDLGSYGDSVGDVAVQSDGRIVVSASTYQDGIAQGYLIRYLADGTLDFGFGASGIVTVPFPRWVYDLAIQQDGKILIAGSSGSSIATLGMAVARYSADGNLDPDFGDGGLAIDSSGGNFWGGAQRLAIQPDGRILASGYGNGGIFVVRLTPAGSPDTSFGSDGAVTLGVGPVATSLVVQGDGKVVVGAFNGRSSETIVQRLNSDGGLDVFYESLPWSHIGRLKLALQSDGALVAVGDCLSTFQIVRWNANGQLDSGFALSGVATPDLGIQEPYGYGNAACSVAIQSDGMIVVAGRAEFGANDAFVLARLDTNGQPDPTFDNDGTAIESDCRRLPIDPSSCLVADRNKFGLKGSASARRALAWKAIGGATFALTDLGTPGTDTRYSLCIYDTQAGVPRLASWLDIYGDPSGWKKNGTRAWTYRGTGSIVLNPDGVQSLRLRASSSGGKSFVRVRAGGWQMPLPMPIRSDAWFDKDPGVIVRLVSSDGFCLESHFSAFDVQSDDGLEFDAETR